MLAIVVAGVGNAVFHVGGGVVCLRLTPHRATAPGLFVAPGSLGLLIGMVLGTLGQAASAPLILASLIACLGIARTRIPDPVTATVKKGSASGTELVIGFVLLSIAIRSLLGFVVTFPWETRPVELILLTTATVAGKAIGGILADRWGWLRVGVGSMVAATPFLACVSICPMAAIPGLLLLNLTMAVTLAAIAEAVPGYPAFSFGLASLALLLGALPSLLGAHVGGFLVVSLVMLFSSAALYRGLRTLTSIHSVPRPVEAYK
jgi:FSR family fosmidomycin resistance protein-like MFS transporter